MIKQVLFIVKKDQTTAHGMACFRTNVVFNTIQTMQIRYIFGFIIYQAIKSCVANTMKQDRHPTYNARESAWVYLHDLKDLSDENKGKKGIHPSEYTTRTCIPTCCFRLCFVFTSLQTMQIRCCLIFHHVTSKEGNTRMSFDAVQDDLLFSTTIRRNVGIYCKKETNDWVSNNVNSQS